MSELAVDTFLRASLEQAEGERWYDECNQPVEYPDWDPRTTRVVSGPYSRANFPGRRFPDRTSARRYWSERARIVEEYRVPGRWIFRIKEAA